MGYFDLKKQLKSTPTTKGGGYFALKAQVNPIIESNRRRDEEARIAEERRRQIQEASDYAARKQQEAKDLMKPTSIAKEYGSGIWEGVKGLGKEMGKAVVRSAAMGADIVNRMSPVETLRSFKSGIDTIGDRQGTETRTQAFKRGVYDFQARPLIYEKAEAKLEGKPRYQLPIMEKPTDIFSPEYRKPITAAAEIPTYLYGARPIATAAKGLLARILARTASTQPEAIIEAGLQTAGEEKPTIKSAAMNWLGATLLMSGISNIAGEVKFKKTDKVVNETVDELENIYGDKIPEEGVDDITDAFNQGIEKETIIENAKKTAPATESARQTRTLKVGELARETKAVEEITGDLKIAQRVEVKNKLEQGFTPEEIADDIMAPKVEAKPEPKQEPKQEMKAKPIAKVEAKPKATITDDIAKAKAEGKSFEEFVETQKLFTGRGRKTDDLTKTRTSELFLTKNRDVAEYYGGTLDNVSEGFVDSSKFIDLSSQKKKAEYVKNNFTIDDVKKIVPEPSLRNGVETLTGKTEKQFYSDWLEELENEMFASGKEQKLLLEKLKKDGYQGAILEDATMGIAGDKNSYIVLDKSALKTKSQLKKLWDEVETKTKPKTKPKATRSTVKKSKLASRMNEDLPDDYKLDEFYDSTTIKKELNQASEDIAKNKDKAMIEAFSKDTKATQRVAKLTELAEIAKKNGDSEAQNAILSRMRREGTEAGQTIDMFKAYNFMNPETEFMKHVVNSRLKKLAVGIKDVTKAKKAAMQKLTEVANDIRKTTKNFKVKDAQDLFNKLTCK